MKIVPQHIAIIMDGNRRWAREKRLPALAGHSRVANEILEPLIEHAATRGIKYLTFWAFSTENWQRSGVEVQGIMQIFRHMIKKRWQRLHKKGVRIRVIGDISKFAPDIQKGLVDLANQTKNNKKITTVFALNYGGRDEILRAIKKVDSTTMTEESFSNILDTAGIPDPEVIVRTSGEQRLSGFLLWQSEYSEFFFPTFHMPDFVPEKLDEILDEYERRKRRFGK